MRHSTWLLWALIAMMASPFQVGAEGRGGYNQFGEYVDDVILDDDALDKTESERLEKKIQFFQDKIKNEPDNASAFFFLGNLFAERNQSQKAVGAYEKAIQLKPENGEYRYRLAKAYHALRDGENAIKHALEAARIFRENLYVHWQTKTSQLLQFLRKEYGIP